METVCQLCNGDLEVMGRLGRLIWLTCRDCGMAFSRNMENEDECDEYSDEDSAGDSKELAAS